MQLQDSLPELLRMYKIPRGILRYELRRRWAAGPRWPEVSPGVSLSCQRSEQINESFSDVEVITPIWLLRRQSLCQTFSGNTRSVSSGVSLVCQTSDHVRRSQLSHEGDL
jgi:hypothetical protein